jgi:enediyne biosynthesis protein E4
LKFFDYDNDGRPDLILSNGFPDDVIDRESHFVTYKEPLLLFHNLGSKFENVSAQGGSAFAQRFASRGLATGDFDNDGAVDVLISVNDAAPLLLKNHAAAGNHWLGVKLIGRKCNADAVGARVRYRAGDLVGMQAKTGGGSFLSAHDPRLVLGAGAHTKIDYVEVEWPQPSGRKERFTDLPIDRYITLTEGTGKPA